MAFQIEFPDDIDPKAGMITLTLADTSKTIQHNVTIQNTKLQQQLAAANAQIQQLQEQARQSAALVANLKFQLAEALKDKPPVDDPPPEEPPVVPGALKTTLTKTTMVNVAGATITADDTPTDAQDEMVRQALELCEAVGLTHARFMLNFEQAKAMAGYGEDDPRNLPAFGRRHHVKFIVDSMNTQAKRVTEGNLTKAQYEDYFRWMKKLGAEAVWFDDVDDVKKAPFIHEWIKITQDAMKTAGLDVPLCGSFMALFDRAKYPGFDFYEIQTFTNKPTELTNFFKRRDVDVFCLDGQRSESVAELKSNTAITLAANIPNFMFYTIFDGPKDNETDWREMPAQVAEIKNFVGKWKTARAALP